MNSLKFAVCVLATTLVALCAADCPADQCSVSAAENTFPTLDASLEDGELTVQTTSYGGQYMFIGAVEEDADGTQGQDTCAPSSAVGAMSDSTDCMRTMTYTWDWDTITNDNCSGSYYVGDNGDFIERSIRVMIVDREISGQDLYGDVCMEIYQLYTLTFRFPTTTYFNDTITGYSPTRYASALINQLSHNLDTSVTHGDLFFTISYPFKLAGDVTPSSGPVSLGDIAITRIQESDACTEDNQSDCDYVFDLEILEAVCDQDGVDPYGEYVFDFQITLRDGVDGPTGFETDHTLSFTIPELVDCNFNLYSGEATVSPYTAWTDPSDGAMTPTTQFLYQQPVTLVIPIAVDFYTPTAGNLNYVRVCEKDTLESAEGDGCGDTYQDIQWDGSGYSTSDGFTLIEDAVYGNVFHIEDSVDPADPTLQITFFFDDYNEVGDAATPHATAFLRFEVLITDMRFSGDTKSLDEVTVFPSAMAATAVSIGGMGASQNGQGAGNNVASPDNSPRIVYKTEFPTTSVAVLCVAGAVFAAFLFTRRGANNPSAAVRLAELDGQREL